MSDLQTNNLMALSFLIDEEIYSFQENITSNPIIGIPKETPLKVFEPENIVISITNDYKYFGDNNKYILIVVKEPNAEFLNKKDLDFLVKIMAAKKWELNDVAILNTEKYAELDFDKLKDFFAFNKIITFGINPTALKITGAVANKKCTYKNVSILGTWNLAQLQSDLNKKTTFWNELKVF